MGQLIFQSFGGNFFSRYLTKHIADVLPRRVKRLLYVSSAMGTILREKSPDTKLVSKINDKLKLAYGASGLLFPIYIGSFIWKQLKTSVVYIHCGPVKLTELPLDKMNDMDCWKTGIVFAKNVPVWLRYGSTELMTADIHDMLVLMDKAA